MEQDNSTQEVHGYNLHYFMPHEAVATVEHNNVDFAVIESFVSEKLGQLEFPAGYYIDVERILNFARGEEPEEPSDEPPNDIPQEPPQGQGFVQLLGGLLAGIGNLILLFGRWLFNTGRRLSGRLVQLEQTPPAVQPSKPKPILERPKPRYSHFALVPLVGVMQEQTQTELLSTLLAAHQVIQGNRKDYQDDEIGIQFSTLAPNWMQGTAQGQVTTGGPGSKPTPPTVTTPDPVAELRSNTTLKISEQVQADAQAVVVAQGVEAPPVVVFILDTVPSEEQIERATKDLTTYPNTHPAKALLELLNTPKRAPQLQIVRAADFSAVAQVELDKLDNPMTFTDGGVPVAMGHPQTDKAHIYDHSYPMRDHGLFIAGLVHDLAPKAEIVLVEALNQYGLGTQISLAAALNYVIENLQGRKGSPQPRVIINISLTILAPVTCGHLLPKGREKLIIENGEFASFVIHEIDKFAKLLEASVESVAWIERSVALHASGARLVAAAGNDGTGSSHPEPRFPALLRSIIGVGAIDADDNLADYSNICDRPEDNGFNTLGGDDDDPDKGLLSVYLGDFPPMTSAQAVGPNNQHYMARWSGTSFACGAFSGVLANLATRLPLDTGLSVLKQQHDIPAGIGQVVRIKQGAP